MWKKNEVGMMLLARWNRFWHCVLYFHMSYTYCTYIQVLNIITFPIKTHKVKCYTCGREWR